MDDALAPDRLAASEGLMLHEPSTTAFGVECIKGEQTRNAATDDKCIELNGRCVHGSRGPGCCGVASGML